MNISQAFGLALREKRKSRNLSQEGFPLISNRTYISSLERGMKSPTLEKIEEICSTLDTHPLGLLKLEYEKLET